VGLLLGSLPAGALPAILTTTGDRLSAYETTSTAPSVAPEANPPTDAAGAFLPDEYRTDGRTNYGGGSGIGAGPGIATDPPKSGNDEVVPAPTQEDRGALTVNVPLIAWSTAFLLIGLSLFVFRRFGRRLA
jgi:hypothetical protein